MDFKNVDWIHKNKNGVT